MKTFAIATLVIATAAFAFTSSAHAGGLQLPGNGGSINPGLQIPKGPINVGQINPGAFKNPGLVKPKFPIKPIPGGPAPVPPQPKGGMSSDEALALGLGIATVGVIAAAAASQHGAAAADDCWYEKQLRYKKSGKAYYKKVLVCE
jgi:hypothetical protein